MQTASGTQTRTFTWSGADLVSTTNPENGTVNYTYDDAHHVLTRTDAKNQQTQYTYDMGGGQKLQTSPSSWLTGRRTRTGPRNLVLR
jgi:YD repeat-containing protein